MDAPPGPARSREAWSRGAADDVAIKAQTLEQQCAMRATHAINYAKLLFMRLTPKLSRDA